MGLLHPPHLLGKLGPDLTLSKSSEKGAGTHLQGICEKADKVCRALGRSASAPRAGAGFLFTPCSGYL